MKITIPYLKPTVVGIRTTTVSTNIYAQPGIVSTVREDYIRGTRPAQFTVLDYDLKIAKRVVGLTASVAVVALVTVAIPAAFVVNLWGALKATYTDARGFVGAGYSGLRIGLGAVVNPK